MDYVRHGRTLQVKRHQVLQVVAKGNSRVHGLWEEREHHGTSRLLRTSRRQTSVGDAISHDDHVALCDRSNAVFHFIELFARLKEHDLKMIRTMERNFRSAVQNQKANIDSKRVAERPNMAVIKVDSLVDKRIGRFPHEVASCSH